MPFIRCGWRLGTWCSGCIRNWLTLRNILYDTEIYFGVDVKGAEIKNVTYSGTPGAVSEFINNNLNNSLASSPGNIFKRNWTKFTVVGEKGVDS